MRTPEQVLKAYDSKHIGDVLYFEDKYVQNAMDEYAKQFKDVYQFVLEIDFMTTTEFCNRFNYPVPQWQGVVQVAVMDMLTVDAAKAKVIIEFAKRLRDRK